MRRTESLKCIKSMCNFKTLSNFQYHRASFNDSVIVASCLADFRNDIYVTYDTIKKDYHLSINFNSITYKNFSFIFTEEFSKQAFEAIQIISLESEVRKND